MFATRAAIGTAETPAAPINGLILFFENKFIIFANITPEAVPNTNATRPISKIPNDESCINLSADICIPTPKPKNIVTMFNNSFCIVLDNLSTTPISFMKLPNVNAPINGTDDGTKRTHKQRTIKGKSIFSILLTSLNCCILMQRSFFVVKARITGGWINGTNAI